MVGGLTVGVGGNGARESNTEKGSTTVTEQQFKKLYRIRIMAEFCC